MRKSLGAALLALGVTTLSHGFDGSGSDGRESGERGGQRILKVFDGQGKVVGPLVSYEPLGTVLNVNGAMIFAPIERVSINNGSQYSASQFEWAGNFSAYLTPDCSGSPLITPSVAPTSQLRPAQIVRQGVDATVYIAGDTYSARTPFMSFRSNGGCVSSSEPLDSWVAESSYSLTQHYPEPLTIHY
ncbi:hypothetical protein R8871_06523 [Paraburkholderia graminis C4D1M]|jgi:hypothetical protein|uniref:Uncharacterized protein n=1 Tax=Paraburkholderia graminis (strain ATCC 700544 / DSM 17151 / LMG 18924 / NCIMB 13744 / C4D1M) TaxID=396598 RepID=B1G6X4_PARG4|nr:hypothetical protein [Paraburkholderia graminis]ALE59085.1 hypothetical protein AC233_31905 [Burkholderia sp. HB1]EDT08194.1 hypothetical protein BgramDRAFT_5120 [Paraburkholderia graminis C4D1M]CAB3739679.1 hypothetical protein R8871_06523 [Paraburkholderia graminis C4D1M]